MAVATIRSVHARQIFDSRGRPTVEVEIGLEDGTSARAAVPSGASTGAHEALELRDGDPAVFEGRGVLNAVRHVNTEIARAVTGLDAAAQEAVDRRLIELDGTEGFRRLGANAVLGTSMAACRAGAVAQRVPLHRHIAALSGNAPRLPLPMVNILSGGAHAARGMDVQDFLVVPVGARSTDAAIGMALAVRAAADRVARRHHLPVLLADEGGLSPGLGSAEAALDLMSEAFAEAGLRLGQDVAIALDVAASELFSAETARYEFKREGMSRDAATVVAHLADLCARYPIVSIEDGLDQDAWPDWRVLTERLPQVQIVGDDLLVTNPDRIRRAAAEGAATCVLIKLNQNGTVTGALEAIAAASRGGLGTVVSARSGETEDPFMADFAVGSGSGQIKIGSVRSSERLAKYNQLIRLAEDGDLPFAGAGALTRRRVGGI